MMRPQDDRDQRITEFLEEDIGLTQQELETAQGYLAGETGDEALEQFTYRDLTGASGAKVEKLFQSMLKRGRKEEAEKLFNVLFAVGQATCYPIISWDFFKLQKYTEVEAYKIAAIHGCKAMKRWHFYVYDIRQTAKLAEENPEQLKKAFLCLKTSESQGRQLLLAAYFVWKYKEFSEEDKEKLPTEDADLLRQYEDLVIDRLKEVLPRTRHPHFQEIIDAVNSCQVTKEVLQLAGQYTVSWDKDLEEPLGFAYLNFQLSEKLLGIVKVCLVMYLKQTLDCFERASLDWRTNIRNRGGDYDEIFGIDPADYIRWAAEKGCKPILIRQLEKNEKCYLNVRSQIDVEQSSRMLMVIKEYKPSLYQQIVKEHENGNYAERDKIINMMVHETPHASVIKGYLRGENPVSDIYPYEDEFVQKYNGGGWRERDLLNKYLKCFQDEVFCRRCQTFMLIKGSFYFLRDDMYEKNSMSKQRTQDLFAVFEQEQLDIRHQLEGASRLYDSLHHYSKAWQQLFMEGITEYFQEYLKNRREETLAAFSGADAFGRFFALHVMRENADENKQEILSYSQDSSKMVKEELLDILYAQRGWEDEMKTLLVSKKAAERELAIRVLSHWQGDKSDYNDLFIQAMVSEKNAKVKSLLGTVLQIEEESTSGAKTLTQEDLVKELHKGGKKRSLAWAYETPFPTVHRTNGEAAGEEYLQAILLCYASAEGCGVSKNAAILAQDLNQAEFALYVNELFDKWMTAGAEAKKRWVLYAASIHGGADIITKLQHQIQEWPQNARGAIASEAVKALALNPLPQALLIVDSISRKFKFKQVKAAAGEALEFAASQLGITKEELADRIVPNLGFDENMERSFDYGARRFKVTITTALEIEVYDETGKKLKNLPAPGKKDDEAKAAAAYEEFKLMKKQMKTTVTSQRGRLEFALSTEREWSVEAWKQLFVKNPIMHQFAIGLIWGVYEDKKLIQSFRYMEDGSFNTEEEDEYELPDQGQIGLVHPIELSKESKAAWKQQLEDYEITQPIEQLDRTVYTMTEEESEMQSLERFGGCILNELSLAGKLTGFGWYRGSVQDAGGFNTYYREDAELGLGVELHFSGSFVGYIGEDITVYDARFYKAGTIERGSYVYDEADKNKAYYLKDIPKRYFSEIVWQLAKATASSEERDENWKAER